MRLFLSGLVGLVAGRRWSPYPDLGEALAPAGHSEPDDASARVRVRRLPFLNRGDDWRAVAQLG